MINISRYRIKSPFAIKLEPVTRNCDGDCFESQLLNHFFTVSESNSSVLLNSLLPMTVLLHQETQLLNLALSSQKQKEDWPTPNCCTQLQVAEKQPPVQPFFSYPQESTYWMDKNMTELLYIFIVMAIVYRGAMIYEAPHAPWDITLEAKQVQSMMIRGGLVRTIVPFQFLSRAYSISPSLAKSSGMTSLLYFLQNQFNQTSVNKFNPMLNYLNTRALFTLISQRFSLQMDCRNTLCQNGALNKAGLQSVRYSSYVSLMGATWGSVKLLQNLKGSFFVMGAYYMTVKSKSNVLFSGRGATISELLLVTVVVVVSVLELVIIVVVAELVVLELVAQFLEAMLEISRSNKLAVRVF